MIQIGFAGNGHCTKTGIMANNRFDAILIEFLKFLNIFLAHNCTPSIDGFLLTQDSAGGGDATGKLRNLHRAQDAGLVLGRVAGMAAGAKSEQSRLECRVATRQRRVGGGMLEAERRQERCGAGWEAT